MKAPPLKKIVTCPYCLDYKGDPKPILQEGWFIYVRILPG
jgi:hypothetical protein